MKFNYKAERERMLNYLGKRSGYCSGVNCDECPLKVFENFSEFGEKIYLCGPELEKQYPETTKTIVKTWSKTHPRETRKEKFLKHYPNAKIEDDNDVPVICVSMLGYLMMEDCDFVSCNKCWDEVD